MPKLSRLLLSEALPFRVVRAPGRLAMHADASALPFVVGELVALGASKVALNGVAAEGAHSLNSSLRRRIVVVDRRLHCVWATNELLAPVVRAIGGEQQGSSVTWPGSPPEGLTTAYWTVWDALGKWLVGHRHRLQVGIDLRETRRALRVLRPYCTDPESLTRLSAIRGIFAGYRVETVDALIMRGGMDAEALDLFDALVDDVTYGALSQYAFGLGWPQRIDWKKRQMGRSVRAILRKGAFRGLLSLGGRSIAMTKGVPSPEVGELIDISGTPYFPTIVNSRKAVHSALRAWERANPPFVSIDRVRETHVGEVVGRARADWQKEAALAQEELRWGE